MTAPVKQLALDLSSAPPQTLDNFVIGRNAELVQRLRNLERASDNERLLYLWGAQGTGRTHLLRGAATLLEACGARASCVACERSTRLAHSLGELDALLVDDVERLTGDAQIDLFNLYNVLKDAGRIFVASGSLPPTRLGLRGDVVTRLAWGLVYEVHGLTDDEKAQALAEHAAARGFVLQPDVSRYLLTHVRRDMAALLAMLDALDRYSLQARRAVTLPLLRELLSESEST